MSFLVGLLIFKVNFMDAIVQIPTLALIGFVIVAFGKICEILLLKFMPQHSTLTEDERAKLNHVYHITKEKDLDGIPLVYVPRSWGQTQKDMKDAMQRIVNDQTRIADILERIEKKLEN
jgi:hypothetical protein